METYIVPYLPLIWAIWTTIGVTATYSLTVMYGHFESYIMYISFTGLYPPERVVFFVVLTIAAFLGKLFIRVYRQQCEGTILFTCTIMYVISG